MYCRITLTSKTPICSTFLLNATSVLITALFNAVTSWVDPAGTFGAYNSHSLVVCIYLFHVVYKSSVF